MKLLPLLRSAVVITPLLTGCHSPSTSTTSLSQSQGDQQALSTESSEAWVDLGQVHNRIDFGADVKLTVKHWSSGNLEEIADSVFGEMKIDLLRIPIYAMREADDPIYAQLVRIMKSVQRVNPNVRFFASVANGDGGDDNDLHHQDKFPDSMKGCCPNNVYQLNLSSYTRRIDDYIRMLRENGLQVDYFGPWNEDPARPSDYTKIFNQSQELDGIKTIGLETWGLLTGVRRVRELNGLVDIIGSHVYDDEEIGLHRTEDLWRQLIDRSDHPVWYTEATRYRYGDDIERLVEGMRNIIPPINAGVEHVTFYQAVPRIVTPRSGNQTFKQPYKYSGFKSIINNTQGAARVDAKADHQDVMITSFYRNGQLEVFIVNGSESAQQIKLNLRSAEISGSHIKATRWTADLLAEESQEGIDHKNQVDLDLDARSFTHIQLPVTRH